MIDLTPYFTTLGLPPDSTLEEVEEAHRDLIAAMHPDQHQGARKERFAKKVAAMNAARDTIRKHYIQWRAMRSDTAAGMGSTTAGAGRTGDDAAARAQAERKKAEEARRKAEEERERKRREAEEASAKRWQEQEQFRKLHEAYVAAQESLVRDVHDRRARIESLALLAVGATVVLAVVAIGSNLIAQARVALVKGGGNAWIVAEKDPGLMRRYSMYREEARAELKELLGREPTASELENYRPPFDPPASTVYKSPPEQDPPPNPDGSDRLTRALWPTMAKHREEQRQRERQIEIETTRNKIEGHKRAIEKCLSEIRDLDSKLASSDLSEVERSRLLEWCEFRAKNIDGERAALAIAEARLKELGS